MTDDKKFCRSSCFSKKSKVFVLIALIVVTVVVWAVILGKIKMPLKDMSAHIETTSVTEEKVEISTDPQTILAILDGEEIKRQDVLDLVNIMPPQMQQIPLEQLFPMALEQLIGNKIVDKKAALSDIENDAALQAQLAQIKTQLMRTKFLENEIKAQLTEGRLAEKYAEYVKNFPVVEEVKAAHILVEDEETARDLIKKLEEGASFTTLANKNSKDGSAANGGDLGYFAKADVVPGFAEAAFATEIGAYTKEPVHSDFGYHIIKIEDKRARPPADYAQAKAYLEKELQRTILDEMLKTWKAEIVIERFDLNGAPLAAQEPAVDTVEPDAIQ